MNPNKPFPSPETIAEQIRTTHAEYDIEISTKMNSNELDNDGEGSPDGTAKAFSEIIKVLSPEFKSKTPITDKVSSEIGRLASEWKFQDITAHEFMEKSQAELNKLGEMEKQFNKAQLELTKAHTRVHTGENSDDCPFCKTYSATGHSQQVPMCHLCTVESELDQSRMELAVYRKCDAILDALPDASNEPTYIHLKKLISERDELRAKVAEMEKSSQAQIKEIQWLKLRLDVLEATEIVNYRFEKLK